MSALDFDPYAVLARIQNQTPTPATVATPATAEPKRPPTVATVAGVARGHVEISESPGPEGEHQTARQESAHNDPETFLTHLQERGPSTYGAVGASLGWGATRAWQAEARLRASGQIVLDDRGRGVPSPTSFTGGRHDQP